MTKTIKRIKEIPAEKRVFKVNPALESFLVPVDYLKPDPKNSRKHPERNIEVIASSFREFGQQKPLIHSNGIVAAGNGALEAVKRLGWTHVAAIEFNGNGDGLKGFKIADNRSAELATWDLDQLSIEFS